MLQKMGYFVIIFSVFHLSNALTETPFTYRFGERLPKDYSSSCPWKCQCPDVNYGNICNCQDQATPNESFPLESPYAALLVQMECNDQRQSSDWPPKETLIQVNLTSEAQKKPIVLETPITIDVTEEPLINDIKLRPKTFPIRYVMYYINNAGQEMSRWYLYQTLGSKLPNKDVDIEFLIFLIPGWTSEYNKQLTLITDALLQANDAIAVVFVDWMFGNQFYLNDDERVYEQTAVNSVYAGYHLASYVYKMVISNGPLSNSFVHFLGFDLGSYVAKYAANKYEELITKHKSENVASSSGMKRKIDRISALDPPFYPFIKTPLSPSDASYVDVYHSNSMINIEADAASDEVIKSIKLNIRNRRFGDPRQLGDADFYINVIDKESKLNAHPQCDHDIVFGCSTQMSTQIFIDSLIKEENDVFNIKNDENIVGVYGITSDADTTNGVYYIEYKHEICSFAETSDTLLKPFISDDEYQLVYGPKNRIIREPINKFPIEEPKEIKKSDNEIDANCGKFSYYPDDGRSTQDGGRIYEGTYPKSSSEQFPFAVCLMKPWITNYKYHYFAKDEMLYKRPKWMMGHFFTYPITYRLSSAQKLGERLDLNYKYFQHCSGSLIDTNWILTAAHCVQLINESQIKVRVGRARCDTLDMDPYDRAINLQVELINPIGKTFFIHDTFKDIWIDEFNKLMSKMEGLGFVPLSSDETHLPVADDVNKYLKYDKEELMNEILKTSKNIGTKNNIFCQQKDKIFNSDSYLSWIKQIESSPQIRVSDVALIRVKKVNIPETPICVSSSIYLNMNKFDQHLYLASFGGKGLLSIDDGANRGKLSYMSAVTNNLLTNISTNITFTTPPAGHYGYNIGSVLFVANIDEDAKGNLVTAAVCGGDSGGPLIAYAKTPKGFLGRGGHQYAIQVGVVSGDSGFNPTGSFPIVRTMNIGDATDCAQNLFYNVYMKKYMIVPEAFAQLSPHIGWINQVLTFPEL